MTEQVLNNKIIVDSSTVTLSLDSENKFPINIELLVKWKVYDRKDHCKRALLKNCTENIDYQIQMSFHKSRENINSKGGRPSENIMLTVDCFKSMCLLSQSKNKITDETKQKLKDEFGIVLDTKFRFTPIETETISYIMKAFNGNLMKTQYQVGVYRIDLYFEIHKLAIECDENGHDYYNTDNEIIRENFIKDKLKCKFIRYNPNVKDFCIFSVINLIMNHIYK